MGLILFDCMNHLLTTHSSYGSISSIYLFDGYLTELTSYQQKHRFFSFDCMKFLLSNIIICYCIPEAYLFDGYLTERI